MIKNPPASVGDAGDMGSIPGLGRSPGIENDNPLQYCCLENSMDREAWRARVHWVANNQTQCMHAHIVYLDTPPGGLIPFLLLLPSLEIRIISGSPLLLDTGHACVDMTGGVWTRCFPGPGCSSQRHSLSTTNLGYPLPHPPANFFRQKNLLN